jgi:hypothetical protein
MANQIIFILGTKPNATHPDNRDLILSDEGDSIVNYGDTVFWVNMVSSITSFRITDDNLHSDVFHPDPLQIEGSMNWKGKVKEKSQPLKGKKVIQESYTISFTQDGQTFSYDPVIRLNS